MSAWRPYQNLIEGVLDNTRPGRVLGWMTLAGIKEPVTFDLVGDFHRDIRGAKIHLTNPTPAEHSQEMKEYMDGFATHQTGVVGDITAGLPPHDYGKYPYIEWYSDQNGRIVLELDPKHVEVIGTPIAWESEKPTSREGQERNMERWLSKLSEAIGAPAIAVAGSVEHPTSPEPSATHKEEQAKAQSPTKAFTVAAESDNTDSFGRRGYILLARAGDIHEVLMSPDHPLTPQKGQVLQVPIREGQPNFAALGFELWRELPRHALKQRVPKATTTTPSCTDNAHDKAGERALPRVADAEARFDVIQGGHEGVPKPYHRPICDIDVKGECKARIVYIEDPPPSIYGIELFASNTSEGVFTPDALKLLALALEDSYRGPRNELDDFLRLCRTAIQLVHHLEQGKTIQSFVPSDSPVEVTSVDEVTPDEIVASEKDAPVYTLTSGRIEGDILERDDGHGNPRYKWRINRPYTDTEGMAKMSSTFTPADIPHAKGVLEKIEQIFKEHLAQDITSEVKIATKEYLKRGRKLSL
jgi:hypothetical protein